MGAGWVVSYQLPCGHHRKLSVRNGDVVDEEIGTERDGIPLSSDIPDPRRDSSSAFSGILQKYHGQLWDVREVIKMNVHLIPQNTAWSTTSLSANPKTASHESPFECLHRFPFHPAVSRQATAFEKLNLVLWCTTDSAGGVGSVFPGLTMPLSSPSKEQAASSSVWLLHRECQGRTNSPIQFVRRLNFTPTRDDKGGLKITTSGDFLSTPLLGLSIDVSLYLSGFLTWYIYSLAFQLVHAPSLRNAIAVYSNVNENFCVSFISFLPPPHLLFPPLNPSFFWLLPHLYGRIPLPKL